MTKTVTTSDQAGGQQARTSAAELTTVYARSQGMLLGEDEDDAAVAVQWLALVARDLVAASVGAGASLMDEAGRRTSAGTTDKVAAEANMLQYDLGEGPCLSAWGTTSPQHVRDTATEGRWVTWCAAARELGIRSVLSAPMAFRDETIGALKVYSTRPDDFGAEDERRLLRLAEAAATLLGAAQGPGAAQRLSAGLQAMLADRQAVEAATGMLMERHRTDHATARSHLVEQSRRQDVPMAQLAREVLTRTDGQKT